MREITSYIGMGEHPPEVLHPEHGDEGNHLFLQQEELYERKVEQEKD